MKTFNALVVATLAVSTSVNAAVPAASSVVYPTVFGENLILNSCMDAQQNLYASSKAPDYGNYVSVFKVSTSGSTVFKVDIPYLPIYRNMYPDSIELVGDTLVMMSGNDLQDGTGGQSDIYFLDPADGSAKAAPLTISGGSYIENGAPRTSKIYGSKLVPSQSNPNKTYAIGGGAAKSVIVCFDISTQTADWSTYYAPPNEVDGASVEDALEVGNYLWFGGFDGLKRLNIATGVVVEETIPAAAAMPVYKLLSFEEGGNTYLLVSGYKIVTCLNADTLAVMWTTNDAGMLQPNSLFGSGTSSDTAFVWFARNLIPESGGSQSDWDVEAGVISTSTGSVQWRTTYRSGDKSGLTDNMVGFFQHAQGSALRVLEQGQIETGYWFWKRTYNVIRLLTFDHTTSSVSSAVTLEDLGVPSEYVGKDGVSWGLTYNGEAIKYSHAAPSAQRSSDIVGDEATTQLDDGFPKGPSVADVFAFIGLATSIVALIAGVALVVRRRRNGGGLPAGDVVGVQQHDNAKSSTNPLFVV